MKENRKEREEFKKESERLLNASEWEINEELIKYGYYPKKLAQEGNGFLEKLKQIIFNN